MSEKATDRSTRIARGDSAASVDARLLYRDSADPGLPAPRGLYDPARDKDSCGVGFIADIKGRKSHQIVEDALTILVNLEHRGAVGADPRAGDGAGILMQIPHKFFARKAGELGFALPEPGEYGVGALFMPRDAGAARVGPPDLRAGRGTRGADRPRLAHRHADRQFDARRVGEADRAVPRQVFIGRGTKKLSEDEFERQLYILRKVISATIYRQYERRLTGFYPVSMSCRTIVYKGMFLADQLGAYYPDLHDPDFECALALVHQRFSTNTFPSWSLAHPYRMVATTARSTRCAATSTGWRRGRRRCPRRSSATTSGSCGRSPTRASPTPPASTTRSSSWCRAATRWRTPR